MTTIAGHTGAHVAPATLVAGGSIVAGVVGASRYGGAAVFASVSCRRTITVDQETKLQQHVKICHNNNQFQMQYLEDRCRCSRFLLLDTSHRSDKERTDIVQRCR